MQAKRDQNNVTTLLAVSIVDGVTPVAIYADPVTHRLLVDNGGGGGTVISVNGQMGVVVLDTDDISEGITNLYYTDARARASISLTTTGTSGPATYNNVTGVLNIPNYTTGGGAGTVTSVDVSGGSSGLTFTGGPITTSGTITLSSGILDAAYGGTGVNNSGKTITLGGNLTTSGAFSITLTATNNTSVTLPVSGTLATLAGTETLTNKTLTTPIIAQISNTGTLTLPTTTDTLVGRATTDTFTNKTFDTAGTGNSFSINGVAVTANTGTGAVVRATSPILVTPTLGVATATSINKVTITAPATSATLTISDGKTLTATNSITLTGTDGTVIDVGAATSGKVLIGNGTNMVLSTPSFPNASATVRKVIVSDGTNWVASTETYATPGTTGNVMTSDGTNWISQAPSSGGSTLSYTAKTTTYSIGTSDQIIDCTSGTFTATLPTASGVTGKFYHIKNSGTGVITIATTSSQTIDAATTLLLTEQYSSVMVVSDGSNWKII